MSTGLKEETGFERIEFRVLELSKFSSVIALTDSFLKDGVRLDILVASAAVSLTQYRTTEDGWEEG